MFQVRGYSSSSASRAGVEAQGSLMVSGLGLGPSSSAAPAGVEAQGLEFGGLLCVAEDLEFGVWDLRFGSSG